jgi:hypothetical protein
LTENQNQKEKEKEKESESNLSISSITQAPEEAEQPITEFCPSNKPFSY